MSFLGGVVHRAGGFSAYISRYPKSLLKQNIELGVQVIKRLQNSIHNPTIEKIATLYNRTGAMEVNDYGARTRTIYNQKPWQKRK